MVERIRTLLESRQLTPTQFADLIGVARPIVSHILSGRNRPSLEVVQRILTAMPELAMPWLLNGSGPMMAAEGASSPESSPEVAPTIIAPAASAAAGISARPTQAEARSIEPASIKQLSNNQYNTAAIREANASMPTASYLGRQQPNKPAMPAGQIGKPTPFKPAATKPVAMPKRFVAVPAPMATPVNVGEPDATPHGSVEPSVPVPPTNVATTELASSPLPATPLPTFQAPIAAASTPEVAGNAPESAMAQALFAGAEKPIRRIVIFYRDGSFADYQPE